MKVTPLNILRFWKLLMFPPNGYHWHNNRMALKMDLPWEPWLHATVWLSAIYTIIVGEFALYPPTDSADIVWLVSGLTAPPVGFASVWMLAFKTGLPRYLAIWLRMVADLGLSISLLTYLCSRFEAESLGWFGITADAIVFASAWFTLTLVVRDIRFIVATERLANIIEADRLCKGHMKGEATGGC